jgi:type I restriction enzyme S subunit
MHPHTGVLSKYLLHYLRSQPFTEFVNSKAVGVAYPAINDANFFQGIVPLPPLAEQTRIVTRVEELMQVCDALEASGQLEAQQHAQLVNTLLGTLTQSETPEALADNWQRIATHFDVLLDRPEAVDALEQTILQLAVRGLLVPQDPTDEPASVLLQKIRTEKDHLIAQGKIKRDKPLPPITDEEKPFDLPQGWEWCRMGDVLDGGSGTTPLRARTDYFTNGTEMWVKTTDLTNGLVITCEELITKAAVAENRLRYFPAGTVCVAMYGGAGTIGKSGVLGVSSTINQSVFALPPTESIDVNFLHTYVITVRSQWMSFAAGLRKDPNINGQIIKKMVMPLPPLAEQSRIVTRVNELRSLCVGLKASLKTSAAVIEKASIGLISLG